MKLTPRQEPDFSANLPRRVPDSAVRAIIAKRLVNPGSVLPMMDAEAKRRGIGFGDLVIEMHRSDVVKCGYCARYYDQVSVRDNVCGNCSRAIITAMGGQPLRAKCQPIDPLVSAVEGGP